MNATSNESTWTNCRPNDKPISSYGFEKNELVLPFSLSFQIHRFLFQERNIRADRDMKEFQTRHLRDEDRAHEARREHIRLSRHIVSEWQGKRKTIHDRLSSSIYQLEPVRNLNHSPDNRPDGSAFFLSFFRTLLFFLVNSWFDEERSFTGDTMLLNKDCLAYVSSRQWWRWWTSVIIIYSSGLIWKWVDWIYSFTPSWKSPWRSRISNWRITPKVGSYLCIVFFTFSSILLGPDIVIHHEQTVLDNMNDWSRTQHTKSGLIELIRQSTISLSEAETTVINFLKQYCPPGTGILAGNSVFVDRW